MSLVILDHTSSENNNGVTANYLKVKVNDKIIELPAICGSKSDYDKATKTKQLIKTNIFQYYVNLVPAPWGHIESLDKIDKIIENFNKIYDKYKPTISDINFWWDGHVWTDSERDSALKLQLKLKTDFVSDIVRDRDLYSLRELKPDKKITIAIENFESQLLNLQNFDTKKIKCPTVSMKTISPVFKQQLDKIKDAGFNRFNVDWTGLSTLEPWLILTKFLKDNNKIWCNMTSVNVRRRQKKITLKNTKKKIKVRRSYLQTALAFGAHSAGLGFYVFPHDDDEEPTAYLLNTTTLQYDVDENGNYKEDDVISFNRLSEKVSASQDYIKNNTYFEKYLPINYLN